MSNSNRGKNAITGLAALMGAGFLLPSANAVAGPDMTVVSMNVGTPRVGSCNKVTVEVKNVGNALANEIMQVAVVARQVGGYTQTRRNGYISATHAGATRTVTIENVYIPSAGDWTIQAVVDAENKVAEDNENNNVRSQRVTAQYPCLTMSPGLQNAIPKYPTPKYQK